jgi:2,3,4,5-tetrahydropyridine-2-carboxylate N-succinyltransferase
MGTLSGGNDVKISIGENCPSRSKFWSWHSTGDNCIIEAGLYITGGSKITTYNSNNEKVSVVKASELSGCNNLLFIRNSQSGAIEAKINPKSVALNKTLHKN